MTIPKNGKSIIKLKSKRELLIGKLMNKGYVLEDWSDIGGCYVGWFSAGGIVITNDFQEFNGWCEPKISWSKMNPKSDDFVVVSKNDLLFSFEQVLKNNQGDEHPYFLRVEKYIKKIKQGDRVSVK